MTHIYILINKPIKAIKIDIVALIFVKVTAIPIILNGSISY